MKILLILLLTFTSLTRAQSFEKNISEVLNVEAADEAKPLLLHLAILEIFKEISPDGEALEKRLEEKFSAHYENFKTQKLQGMAEEEKEAQLKVLESQRAREKVKFSSLEQTLDSFVFNKVEMDPTNPGLWKASLNLQINKEKFEKFKTRLLMDESKKYAAILMMADIAPMNFEWKELGVDTKASFTLPLLNSWSKFVTHLQPVNVEKVLDCEGECLQDFQNWELMSKKLPMNVPEGVKNSLWLKIFFHLKKVAFSAPLQEWSFEWEGRAVLLDTNTKKVIYSQTLYPEKKTWRGLDQKTLNSTLASSMYRSALDALTKISKKVEVTPKLNRLQRVVVQGHKNLSDVLLLIKSLQKEGLPLHLELQLDNFSPKEAHLLAFYQGEEKSFTDLLSQVKELKSFHSYKLVSDVSGAHPILKLLTE